MFDAISYLRMRGIRVWTQGKNVSPGWIGIRCLYCSDQSNHLGINLKSGKFRCWKCKKRGHIRWIIQTLEGVSEDQANQRILEYDDPTFTSVLQDIKYTTPEKVLPKEATKDFWEMHIEYLRERNFDAHHLIRKYDLYCTHNVGDYKFRIVVPVKMNQTMVCFTARDVTGKQELRYKSSPLEGYTIDPSRVLYNIDSVYDTAIVMEGVTDVWRVGDPGIALLNKEFNPKHLLTLQQKGVRRCFFIYDAEKEATEQAKEAAAMASGVMPVVEQIELREGDPGSLSPKDALELRKFLGL